VSAAARRKRSAIRWLVFAPFWAGLFGAGIFLCALGFVLALRHDRLLPGSGDGWMIFFAFVATAVALFRGYDTPVRSYAALVGRLLGGLVGGVLICAVIVALATAHHRSFDDGVRFVVGGAVCVALPLARRHGRRLLEAVRVSPSSRWEAATIVAVLALASVSALSARARCALGSGSSCYRAAGDEGDGALALRLAERGCALDDERACAMAGHAYWKGNFGPRDRARAESLLRTGCALDDPEACRDLSMMELEQGCEGYRASACRALAEAYRRGDGEPHDRDAARWASSQACLLGDAEACAAR